MYWITGLKIENYRAFSNPESISIPYNHHLIIYGENGSGKSSLYNAIKDFFNSSDNSSQVFNLNEFTKVQGNSNGAITISVELQDSSGVVTTQDYLFTEPVAASTHKKSEIQLANKIKGFLDYKKVLRVHGLEVPPDNKPNIFDLLIKDLLCYHRVPNPQGGITTVELYSEYNKLTDILCTKRRNTHIYSSAKLELERLDSEFINLLRLVFSETNILLSTYFKNKLRLDINYSNLQVNSQKKMTEQISLRVYYAEKEIDNYHVFLNEARLSALAICLYLASIKINPPVDTLRVLFLDDVFIGLDMSNRIPLLEIIKNEFIQNGFQLFISTYDRQWYELARYWFENHKCSVKCIEMFIGDDSNPASPEYPVIIDTRKGHFETAKAHFEHRDYAAAANCLRKACEAELKRILPKHKKLNTNFHTGEIHKIDKLEVLVNNFFEFMTKNNLNVIPFNLFKTYKKIILNPLSHDDLEAPHYKAEIQAGIQIIESLQKIEVKEIFPINHAGSKDLKFGIKDAITNQMHHYEFQLLENLQILKQETGSIQLSAVECNLVENGCSQKFTSMDEAFNRIYEERGYPATTVYDEFYKKISISNRKKLIDIMVFD